MSKLSYDDHARDFIQWAKNNGLRLQVRSDGNEARPVVPSRSRKFDIHLFDGFKNHVGLWVGVNGPNKLNRLVRELELMGYQPRNVGFQEAIFLLSKKDALTLAPHFKMFKTAKTPVSGR